ncbi:MAG: T9SS type A sorting domain-containing protein [Flavobacteriales bacterium]
MKKFFTGALLFAFSFLLAQNETLHFDHSTEGIAKSYTPEMVSESIQNIAATQRNNVWENNFDNPSDWTLSGPTGLGVLNGFSIVSTGGTWFFNTPINSTSGGNYLRFQNGNPTATPPTTLNAGPFTATYNNPINIGDGNVVFEFKQFGARFFEFQAVQVSFNNGVSWITIGSNDDIERLTNNGGSAYANPSTRRFNVFPHIPQGADLENMQLRFFWDGQLRGQAIDYTAYGWFIDDLRIFNAPEVDLILNKVYHHDIINDFQFTVIPQQQTVPLVLGAEVVNNGTQAQTFTVSYEIKEGNNTVNSGNFPAQTLSSQDTVLIWHNANFTPTNINNYSVEFTVTASAGSDEFPTNNTKTSNFRIDEKIYASVGSINAILDWNGGTNPPFNEHKLANFFSIRSEALLKAVNVAFAPGTTVGKEVIVEIWEAANELVNLGQTFYQIKSSDVNTGNASNYVTIKLDLDVILEAEKIYLVSVGNADNTGRIVFRASTGDDDNGARIFGPFGTNQNIAWFRGINRKPAINMNFDQTLHVAELNNEFNVSLHPNPAKDFMYVSLKGITGNRLEYRISDMQGRIVASEMNFNIANNANLQIPTSKLETGVYFIQLINGQHEVTKKFVVVK